MGSVNWQKSKFYEGLKDYEKQTGLSLAERNAQMNPNGNHSTLGVLGVSLFTGLFNMGLDYASGNINGSQDTGSETDVKGRTEVYSEVGQILAKFDNAIATNPQNTTDIDKYLKELEDLKNANPSNNYIKNVYELAVKKKEQHSDKLKKTP